MAGPQEFTDTNSAMGQGPTQDPSHFITASLPGGSPAGGTENLRADEVQHGPTAKGAHGSGEKAKVAGVAEFEDGEV